VPHHAAVRISSIRIGKRPEASRHVGELLVDAALAKPVKATLKANEQLVDVAVHPVHGRQPAGVLAGKRINAGAKERDEQLLARLIL
jgi:hypothetical protein